MDIETLQANLFQLFSCGCKSIATEEHEHWNANLACLTNHIHNTLPIVYLDVIKLSIFNIKKMMNQKKYQGNTLKDIAVSGSKF